MCMNSGGSAQSAEAQEQERVGLTAAHWIIVWVAINAAVPVSCCPPVFSWEAPRPLRLLPFSLQQVPMCIAKLIIINVESRLKLVRLCGPQLYKSYYKNKRTSTMYNFDHTYIYIYHIHIMIFSFFLLHIYIYIYNYILYLIQYILNIIHYIYIL